MSERIDEHALHAFAARRDEGPVVMLNLLKFVPDGGAASYRRYTEAVAPLLAKVGGEATYLGKGAELLLGRPDDAWDLVMLVRYPRRGALLEMITSDAYKAIVHHRQAALARSVLLATDPLG